MAVKNYLHNLIIRAKLDGLVRPRMWGHARPEQVRVWPLECQAVQVSGRCRSQGGDAPTRAKSLAMTEHVASRTLVKSPPELWAECSDAASLARHLDGFGEIRITRLEPETAVAWEGERARGTVRIEPSGWGTR